MAWKLEFNKNEGFLYIFIHTTVMSHGYNVGMVELMFDLYDVFGTKA